MKIQAYYDDGTYEEFMLPELSFAQGYMIDNQRLIMTDWQEKGIRIDRSYWPTPDAEGSSEGLLICNPVTLITPTQLATLRLLIADGKQILERDDDDELKVVVAATADTSDDDYEEGEE